MGLLDAPAGRPLFDALVAVSLERGAEELAAGGAAPPAAPAGSQPPAPGASSSALMVVDSAGGALPPPPPPRPDSLADLLGALGAAYAMRPALFLDDGLCDDVFKGLMQEVATHEVRAGHLTPPT